MANAEDDKKNQASCSNQIKVRCLIQQCVNAKLQVKLADIANNIEPEFVQVFLKKKKIFFTFSVCLNL